MRSIDELLDVEDSAWALVQRWISEANQHVEVLPRDVEAARQALWQTQVTTRSPMGAIIFETGGLLVDHGWVRILGSGHQKLPRTLATWNNSKTFTENGQAPSILWIADDVVGGFFALNGGGLGAGSVGLVHYFAPDTLSFECLDFSYTGFIQFCLSGNLSGFYERFRWLGWIDDIAHLTGAQVFNFYPPLWSKEGKEMGRNSRKLVTIEEQFQLTRSFQHQLKTGGAQ